MSTLTLLKSCPVSLSFPTSRSTRPGRDTASSGSTRQCTASKKPVNLVTVALSLSCLPLALSKLISTPCLFRHLTRPISFVLVVDDFDVWRKKINIFSYMENVHLKCHILDNIFGYISAIL
jgi:hypothetical protein